MANVNYQYLKLKYFKDWGKNLQSVADCHRSIFCLRAGIQVLNENLKGKAGSISVQITERRMTTGFTKALIPPSLNTQKRNPTTPKNICLVHNAVANNLTCPMLLTI